MKGSKKTFFILAAIFLVIMILIGVDMAMRTTPAWKKNDTMEHQGLDK